MKIAIRLLAVLIIIQSGEIQARQQTTKNAPGSLPSWVQMIDNPDVNFYEAQRIFNQYWEGKLTPEEEYEETNPSVKEQVERDEKELLRKQMTTAQHEEYDLLKYHYKRFRNWSREVKPFVQEDGRILSQKERIDMRNKQQDAFRKQK